MYDLLAIWGIWEATTFNSHGKFLEFFWTSKTAQIMPDRNVLHSSEWENFDEFFNAC